MSEDASSNRLKPTLEDTLGPYYPVPFLDGERMDLTVVHPGLSIRPQGTPVVLRGAVRDIDGGLAHGVLLEFRQADANGRLRDPTNEADPTLDPNFEGVARCRTDGTFHLRTVFPGAMAAELPGELPRAPHVTLTVFSDGINRVVTQIFFDGRPENAEDPVLLSLPEDLRPRLIARWTGEEEDGAQVHEIEIVMAGEDETPFFDDLMS